MKNIFINKLYLKYVLLLVIATITYSCEERLNHDDDLPNTLNIIESIKIGQTSATIDNLSGVVDFVLPSDVNLSSVVLEIRSPQGVEISPANGTMVDLTTPLEITAKSGGKTRKYIVNARLLPSQIAFVNEALTMDAISDDDVKAAAQWTKDTYGDKFVYIPFSNLTIEALKSVNVVFFFYDNTGSSNLPQASLDKKNVLIQYVVEGGKMLLGGMATSYAEVVGRDKSGLLTIKSSSAGGINNDVWSIDGGVNFQIDQRSSPIYNFTTIISSDVNGYFPVINGGFKEDHNTMWDLGPLLAPGHQLGQFAEFQRLYGAKVLATWSGVTDEAVAGIVEFTPTSVYAGTIIGIGFGGMEWAMNDGRTNVYAFNIKGIYRNAIDYLGTK
ncbi:DUF4960 domain-containing protein [Flavobacterium sp. UMI-01]|uniref:DUF4960 domain-containing protein n=1 Tax=Flavobacterium sp. UMI-01 TaxID=1441053 RepID=UPI001C7CC0A8|nr:DUF4960 domain-containing protein [Flavobacterium sp. UMI-01]GIZ09242.1 hypothetical protein FUMI01_19690 [Flavobacterium sp. UMI-01]